MGTRKSYVVSDNQLSLFDLETPSMPIFDKSRCEARFINYETAARMIETYHYAHRVPSIVVAVGMFVDEVLAGCITYGIPANTNMLSFCPVANNNQVLELNRLFIFDWVGRNRESWLIGQSFNLLHNYLALISYADEGHQHYGYIYQATNWLYTGVSKGDTKWIIGNKEYHRKSIYNQFGTSSIEKVKEIVNCPVTITREGDKHRYVYFLGSKSQKRKLRKALKWPVLPYPKGVTNAHKNDQIQSKKDHLLTSR